MIERFALIIPRPIGLSFFGILPAAMGHALGALTPFGMRLSPAVSGVPGRVHLHGDDLRAPADGGDAVAGDAVK